MSSLVITNFCTLFLIALHTFICLGKSEGRFICTSSYLIITYGQTPPFGKIALTKLFKIN